MNIQIDRRGDSIVAVAEVDGGELAVANVQDALDLMATARYEGADSVLLPKEAVHEDFFQLRSGLAGEVLQKYTNYGFRVAFVGDFGVYDSKALRDFIYESNKGGKVLFLPTREEALDALHGQK